MDEETTITCCREDKIWEGSCNACQDRNGETVIVVSMKNKTFRLCDTCAELLSKRLNGITRKTG